LQQQGMQPLDTNRMAGGWAVPISPWEGVAKIAQSVSGSMMEKQNTERKRELVRQLQGDASRWYGNAPQERPASAPGFGGEPEQPTGGTVQPSKQEQMQHLMQGMNNPFSAPIAQMQIAQMQKLNDPYTLGPGAVRMGPDGKPIASAPFKPEAPHTRNIQRGDQKVAQEFDPTTRTWTDVPGASGPAFARQVAPIVQTGDHAAFTNVQPDGQGGFIGLSKRTGQMEKIPQQAGVAPSAALTGDALDNAASRYALDGTLPSNLGRGNQGAMNTVKILSRAAEIAKERGDSPEASRIRQLANKASSAALTDLSKREAQVGAFERTFVRNTQLVDTLSDRLDRTGVPLANKWIQAGKRAVTGDPDLSALDAAIKGAVNEYTKIVSGSMGNTAMAEGEIKKIESLLSAAQTPEQVKAVIQTMKVET